MPLSQLSTEAQRVSEVCDLLEELADDLPQQSVPMWREAARLTATVMPQHMNAVSQVLIGKLLNTTKSDPFCQNVLRRAQIEVADCTASLPELTELLEQGCSIRNSQLPPEALGYALRSYFDAVRRHLAWETKVLVPLALHRCSSVELEDMRRDLLPMETQGGRSVWRLFRETPQAH